MRPGSARRMALWQLGGEDPEVWEALRDICLREDCTLAELVDRIDRGRAGQFTSAIRRYVLQYYRDASTECGHKAAGHGVIPEESRGHK